MYGKMFPVDTGLEQEGMAMGPVMNTVYNNYLTTYTQKPLTKYDSHKKSELRNVYNSIVKLNKDAPLVSSHYEQGCSAICR